MRELLIRAGRIEEAAGLHPDLVRSARLQAGGYAPRNAGVYPLYYAAYNEPRMINFYISRRF